MGRKTQKYQCICEQKATYHVTVTIQYIAALLPALNKLCGLEWAPGHHIMLPPLPTLGDLQAFPILKIWLIFGHSIKRPGDLDFWPFDLGRTGVECQPWHEPSCQFWCFRDFSLLSYGQTRVRMTTSRYNLNRWPLESLRMSVILSSYSICIPSLKFIGHPIQKI